MIMGVLPAWPITSVPAFLCVLCVIGIHEGPLVLPIISNKSSLFFHYPIPMLCQITAALLLAANVAVAAPFASATLVARQRIGGAWNESAFTQEIQIQ